VRQSVLGIPAAAESAASAFRLSPRQLELPTGMRREFRMLPPNEPPVASVDDGLRQLGLSFDDAADVSPAYRVIEAVKTPVTRPKTPTKAAPKVAPKRTSAAKADASAKAAEAKRAENIARLKESQARVAAGKSLAKKSAPITRITSEEIARATEEFLKRGGVVERLAPGQSGLPTPPVPVAASTGPSLQEALLQNVNLALGQREANRRGRQKVWGMAPIIAAILGGQSFQN